MAIKFEIIEYDSLEAEGVTFADGERLEDKCDVNIEPPIIAAHHRAAALKHADRIKYATDDRQKDSVLIRWQTPDGQTREECYSLVVSVAYVPAVRGYRS